jgi:hypothetical protein
MVEKENCICGKEATRELKEIDESLAVVEKEGLKVKEYFKVCENCFKRIKKLYKSFHFTGVFYNVEYYRDKDIFAIYSKNEYGDEASLVEGRKYTRKYLRDLWTGEIVIMDNDEVIGVW